jgi:VanZ family protein
MDTRLIPTQRMQASPIARAACLVYGMLLLYSGLSPWSGWRDLGIDAWAYLTAPAPHYITTFDLVANVLAYMPFGALIVLAVHPRLRGLASIALAALGSVLLSGSIEAVQTYLPTRIASNIDLLSNSMGALAGAIVAAPLASTLIDRGRLADWRRRWFERHATAVLIAVAAWPVAQIYPASMLFGNGELRLALEPVIEALGGRWWMFDADSFGPAEFVLAEAFVVAASVLAAGLALSSVMRPSAPRYRLLIALLCAALAAKSLANAAQFGPDRALAWLTPGAAGGLALGLLSLVAASGGRRVLQARLALLALVVLMVAVNVVPDNPYHLAQMQEWRQGRLLNFNALTHWLAMLWPPALTVGLLSFTTEHS